MFIQGWCGDEVFSSLQIHRNLLCRTFTYCYINCWESCSENERGRGRTWSLRVCLLYYMELGLQPSCIGKSHPALTFKFLLFNAPKPYSHVIVYEVCVLCHLPHISHGTWVSEFLHGVRWGDVYDPPCRRKNKQKRNEEEEEGQRRRRNNKNRKEVFPCFLQLFSHGKGTGYPTQLVTIEWTSLVGSGIDNLCLLSYTS